MAVSKVLIICVSIGFVSQVSNHPVKRSSEKTQESSNIYLLPKPIIADDTIEITLAIPPEYFKDFKPISISLMKENKDIACTIIIKNPKGPLHSDENTHNTIEENWENLPIKKENDDGVELIFGFTIRENRMTGQVDIIQIIGTDTEIKDIQDINNVKYLNITGHGFKVSELKFTYL